MVPMNCQWMTPIDRFNFSYEKTLSSAPEENQGTFKFYPPVLLLPSFVVRAFVLTLLLQGNSSPFSDQLMKLGLVE